MPDSPNSSARTTTLTADEVVQEIRRTAGEANAIHFFLFINPHSGSQQGAQILDLNLGMICFKSLPDVRVHVYSLVDEEECDNGLSNAKAIMVKKEQENLNPMIHICCGGGDGSLTGLLPRIEEKGMDVSNISFSLLPFGTGNDLSRFLGTWSLDKQAAKDIMRSGHLRHLVYKQIRGRPVNIDVWNVHVTTFDQGFIKPVKAKQHESKDDTQSEICKKLLNNGAIGAQCYVGGDAERLRTSNRVANIASYTIQTIKWGLFKSFTTVTSMIDRIEQNGEIIAHIDSAKYRRRPLSLSRGRSVGSAGSRKRSSGQESRSSTITADANEISSKPEPVIIDKKAIELVFQNIPSLWGRMLNLWNRAETGSAVEESSESTTIPDPVDPSKWHKQTSHDGEFELFLLENKISYVKKELAIDRTDLARIGHFKQARIVFRDFEEDQSPFRIPKHMRSSFSASSTKEKDPFQETKKDCIRIMIDGEFFIVRKPKFIDISFWKQIKIMGPPDDDLSEELEDSGNNGE
ncbi:hypothetical protein INT43_008606 [Umbelopsis isabellina]|uniref:DAGKc domain-containing protein n=1 Tax=Mortierella isabellina TaxID=91625 RepID=A0A8H7PX16_MORIS|nr:hypothetical protein INT43_008606 [Umbelopsis isabellina]